MNDDEPPDLLAELLRAVRRGEPWVIALILITVITVILAGLLWLATHPEPPHAPAPAARHHLMET